MWPGHAIPSQFVQFDPDPDVLGAACVKQS